MLVTHQLTQLPSSSPVKGLLMIYCAKTLKYIDIVAHSKITRIAILLTRFLPIFLFSVLWLFSLAFLLLTKENIPYEKAEFIIKNAPFDHFENIIHFISLKFLFSLLIIYSFCYMYKTITTGILKEIIVFRWKPYTLRHIANKKNFLCNHINVSDLTPKRWEILLEEKDEVIAKWSGIGSNIWITTKLFDRSPGELSQELDYFTHNKYCGVFNLSFYFAITILISVVSLHLSVPTTVFIILLIIPRILIFFDVSAILYSDLTFIKKYGYTQWINFTDRTSTRKYLFGDMNFDKNTPIKIVKFILVYPFSMNLTNRKQVVTVLHNEKFPGRIRFFGQT